MAPSPSSSRIRLVAGVPVPSFVYGTAWKEEATEGLMRQALEAGFRDIDTANQRRHYPEAGVGAAVTRAIADGLVTRDELFLQTKFTYVGGQDHRLPYDPRADEATQVGQSFASSLEQSEGNISTLRQRSPRLSESMNGWRRLVRRSGVGGPSSVVGSLGRTPFPCLPPKTPTKSSSTVLVFGGSRGGASCLHHSNSVEVQL